MRRNKLNKNEKIYRKISVKAEITSFGGSVKLINL